MNMTKFRRYATRLTAVAMCSAALSAVPMPAQGGGGRMQMTSDQQVAAVDKAVTLTDDQKVKVKAIFDDQMKQTMDLRNSGGDPADMRPKMMAIRTAAQAKIKALLTDDQKPKFDAYVAAMPQGRGGGGGGGTPPPPQ